MCMFLTAHIFSRALTAYQEPGFARLASVYVPGRAETQDSEEPEFPEDPRTLSATPQDLVPQRPSCQGYACFPSRPVSHCGAFGACDALLWQGLQQGWGRGGIMAASPWHFL